MAVEVRALRPEEWKQARPKVINFVRRYGDRRITQQGLDWLKRISEAEFKEPGTGVWVALENRRLVGLAALSHYGIKESLIVVHPQIRNRSVAKNIVETIVHTLGKIYGRVAYDNHASLGMCLSSGMVVFARAKDGPTGKPTYWVGGGKWKKEDIFPPKKETG